MFQFKLKPITTSLSRCRPRCSGHVTRGNESNTSTSAVGSVDRVRADVREYIESEFLVGVRAEGRATVCSSAPREARDAVGDKIQVTKLTEESFKAMDCMYYVFPNTKAFPVHAKAYAAQNELQARTYNTKARSLARVSELEVAKVGRYGGRAM